MRIGCLLDSLSRRAGGVSESTRRLTQCLADAEQQPVVFGLIDKEHDADVAKWHPLQLRTFAVRSFQAWGYSPELTEALAQEDLDILLTHGLWKYCSLAALRWHRRTDRPYMVHPHGMLDSWAVQNARWKKRLALLLYENAHLRGAACIRALCDAEARSIRAFGLRNPICVIPNGVDLPDVSQNRIAPWSDDVAMEKVLLYLGRLHPKKNLLALLEAWKAVRVGGNIGGDWTLVIAGWTQGGYVADLRERARDLGIETSVRFVGPLFDDKKASAYQNADAFILPSLSEGLPMVVLEAWSFAKPVLMTAECNLPEGFGASAAVQIGSASDTIASGLRKLFEMSDADRIAMGARGRAVASQRFAWPTIGEEMRRVCDWVVGGGAAPDSVRFR